jgi:acid phosphatase
VILIMEENHSYSQVIGPAAYQTSLSKLCGRESASYGLTYPSLPNYMGLTGGTIPAAIVGKDCQPTGTCVSTGASIFSQAASWKVYAESMPSNCYRSNTSNGLYVPRHTAAPYYTKLAGCSTRDVPLGTTSSGAFEANLASGSLPAFSLVAPNTTDDGHSGCLSCSDNWLKTWMPIIINSPAYQDGSTAVIITYDSDENNAGNHVATIVVAPSVKPGTVVSTRANHYATLRTIEDTLGIATQLGGAAGAPSLKAAFNL